MKKWFWIAGLVSAAVFLSCMTAQKVSPEDATYSETVAVAGMSKDELFDRINLWSAGAFKGPDAAFDVPEPSRVVSADRDQGVITADHTLITDWGKQSATRLFLAIVYTGVSISVSDGQYRLVCSAKDMQVFYAAGLAGTGYTKKAPFDGHVVPVTRASWKQLADALRDTVSGTVIN